MNIIKAMMLRRAKRRAAKKRENAINAWDCHIATHGTFVSGHTLLRRLELRRRMSDTQKAFDELLP